MVYTPEYPRSLLTKSWAFKSNGKSRQALFSEETGKFIERIRTDSPLETID